ncbi:MAG: hypothetical protein KC548_03745, partial [Nanoarchaeota archaeon]|nr:hypothetical protein [Nanoarchaeota archaeon]
SVAVLDGKILILGKDLDDESKWKLYHFKGAWRDFEDYYTGSAEANFQKTFSSKGYLSLTVIRGELYFLTGDGVYIDEDGEFVLLFSNGDYDRKEGENIIDYAIDSKGNYFIETNWKILRFDGESVEIVYESSVELKGLAIDRGDIIAFGTSDKEIYALDDGGEGDPRLLVGLKDEFAGEYNETNPFSYVVSDVSELRFDTRDNLYFKGKSEVYRLDADTGLLQWVPLTTKYGDFGSDPRFFYALVTPSQLVMVMKDSKVLSTLTVDPLAAPYVVAKSEANKKVDLKIGGVAVYSEAGTLFDEESSGKALVEKKDHTILTSQQFYLVPTIENAGSSVLVADSLKIGMYSGDRSGLLEVRYCRPFRIVLEPGQTLVCDYRLEGGRGLVNPGEFSYSVKVDHEDSKSNGNIKETNEKNNFADVKLKVVSP